MELELKKLYDTVASIHEEMFYLRERYKHNFPCNIMVLFCFNFKSHFMCILERDILLQKFLLNHTISN